MKAILPENDSRGTLDMLKTLFAFPQEKMELMIADFREQMQKGLAGEESRLKMIPTYITLPTGNEQGYSLAIDMGGTNLRVMLVKLQGKEKEPEIILSRKKQLSQAEITSDADTLFAGIAGEVNQLLLDLEDKNITAITSIEDVGFTFSYPVKMVNRNSGIIVTMAKELKVSGIIGEDPFKLLFKAFHTIKHQSARYPLTRLKPRALLNDTVTELIYSAYLKIITHSGFLCRIGGIIGTGSNFALVLKTKDIKKFNDTAYQAEHMIINIESGNFDALSLPKNKYDADLDANSTNPGEYRLEKMIAGKYLGNIAALVMQDCIQTSNLFKNNQDAFKLLENLTSLHISAIEASYKENPDKAREQLAALGINQVSDQDLQIIYEISHLVSGKAARVATAIVAAIVQFIDPELIEKHTIAIDGSVFGKYPGYKARMESALKQIFHLKADNLHLEYISDGSGIGAAIAAKEQT